MAIYCYEANQSSFRKLAEGNELLSTTISNDKSAIVRISRRCDDVTVNKHDGYSETVRASTLVEQFIGPHK